MRWVRRLLMLAVATAIVWDLSRPPAEQRSAAVALAGIHAYQRMLSTRVGELGVRCRFTPTCSRYAEAVIRQDGLVKGSWRALTRLLRCGPWTPLGTVDNP